MSKAIVSLSGGMDSATVLGRAIAVGREVECFGFVYGAKHNKYENAAAKALADHYKVPFWLIDLSGAMAGFKSNLLLSGGEIPEGHYEAPSMSLTVVPGRNSIFATVLLGLAQSRGAEQVWLGIHAGDHAIYPDCRPKWFSALSDLYQAASEGAVRPVAPFIGHDKGEILKEGLAMKVPYHLTRTCYKDQPISCQKCGSCTERLESFQKCGAVDPIPYQ